jgi:hypothetical protein
MDTTLKIQSGLNRDLWRGDNSLSPEVRSHLLTIANDFLKDLTLPEGVVSDIVITGSMTSRMWSPMSDLDLHIIVDKSKLKMPHETIDLFMNDAKSLWNRKHHITIKGFPVEIYLQGKGEENVTPGVYSLVGDRWLTKPDLSETPVIDTVTSAKKAGHFVKQISRLQKLMDDGKYKEAREDAETLRTKVKQFRDSGLHAGGFSSVENIAFKFLRRNGWLDKLRNIDVEAYDKLMSVDKGVSNEDYIVDAVAFLLTYGSVEDAI